MLCARMPGWWTTARAVGQAERAASLRADQVCLDSMLEKACDVVGVGGAGLEAALGAHADLGDQQGAPDRGRAV